MTPAERLLAAADLLDKRAGEATKGPWWVNSKIYPETIYGDDASAVISGSRWCGEANVFDNDADAAYIATMHPEVGKALAKVLRSYAEGVRELEEILPLGAQPESDLLTVAGLILAGAP